MTSLLKEETYSVGTTEETTIYLLCNDVVRLALSNRPEPSMVRDCYSQYEYYYTRVYLKEASKDFPEDHVTDLVSFVRSQALLYYKRLLRVFMKSYDISPKVPPVVEADNGDENIEQGKNDES